MSFPPPTERQARLIWLALTGLALAMLVGLATLLVWGVGRVLGILSPVLWPLAIAGILAYLLEPVVDYLHRLGVKRRRAILYVFGLALVLLTGLCASVVPQLVSETRELANRVPAYANRLEQQIEDWANHPPPLIKKLLGREAGGARKPESAAAGAGTASSVATNASGSLAGTNGPAPLGGSLDQQTLQSATGWVARVLPQAGSWLFGQVGRVASWFSVLAGLALVPVYVFYFLVEKDPISSHWTEYLPVRDSGLKNELVFVLNAINDNLIAFFRGQVLVAICDGILYGIGFLFIGLPYALLIGVMAIFLTMIPYLGALVTCLTDLVIALVQFGDWSHSLLVLAVFGCVQVLESLVISPKIMAGRVGLHPLTIIIAVMAGTTLLGGLLGGVLAIPLAAALRVVMFRYVWKRRPDQDA
jgi:predicted PurR-regulated permease PerM